jgi:chromosome partitioning protein
MDMAVKVALINMKGGVGKSTLSVNLAWHYAGRGSEVKRALLIDADPQFNSTQYMLGEIRYRNEVFNTNHPTIWNIFEQLTRIPGSPRAAQPLTDTILRVITFTDNSFIDLIPAQLELSYTLKNPGQKERLLAEFIATIENNYDLIIVDCAPTESMLTEATYLTVDKILVPVKPDRLSTIGLPLLVQSLNDFSSRHHRNLEIVGIVFNTCMEYVPEEVNTKQEVRAVAQQRNWYVFDNEVPFSRSFPRGAREGEPLFRTRYAHTSRKNQFDAFFNEFAWRAGL